MSPEDTAHIASLNRAVQRLAAQVETLIDQGRRKELLDLAATVMSPDPSVTPLERDLAATQLALLVVKSIPAPRPVAVPEVLIEKESAC
jgi:hypothetical protein